MSEPAPSQHLNGEDVPSPRDWGFVVDEEKRDTVPAPPPGADEGENDVLLERP